MKIGGGIGLWHAAGAGEIGLRRALRIDHQHQAAAAHDELVDRVLRLVGEMLRLRDQQHLDFRVDFPDLERDTADLIALVEQ